MTFHPFHALRARSTDGTSASSLRRRFVFSIGAVAVAVLLVFAWLGDATVERSMTGQRDANLRDAARRSALLVNRVIGERERQAQLIALEASVIAAAKRGTMVSNRRRLPSLDVPALEARFAKTRSQQVDTVAQNYLADLLPRLDIAEVMITDEYGYNAVVTSPSSDFVQSDELWWQRAWRDGVTEGAATEDHATGQPVEEIARALVQHGTKFGVMKVKFGLSALDTALIQGSVGTALRVDLVDSAGRVIASSAGGRRFATIAGAKELPAGTTDSVISFADGADAQRGVVRTANGGRWRIIAHTDEASFTEPVRNARLLLFGGLALLLGALVGSLALVSGTIERRVTHPAGALAAVAEAVAAGDLSRSVPASHADDEIGRLTRAVGAMISELRRLATALSSASHETSAMSAEITAGTEEMAASAGEIAHTASDLSAQSTGMAHSLQSLSSSAAALVRVAGELNDGAHDGVARNTQMRELAHESRRRLDDSSRALSSLASDVEASASAIESLGAASMEVRTFVTLVQKLARQSKLLALNAAMEAARAGEHGHGFAVVASEVRRLSAMSSDAAQRTEHIMGGVLKGIEESRASSSRSVVTVRQVIEATDQGARAFVAVEEAVAQSESWTAAIETAASSAHDLVGQITSRLAQLSSGTESFAAAMQQVAASSEEQSASTEQIAAAAATLSTAAERLQQLVANLRLESIPGPGDHSSGRAPEVVKASEAPTAPIGLEVAVGY